ncbi:MAG TPA: hypothetical protein VFE96_05365, partial [Candidatus Bathyarchaeia archaeon]|nr:hypothetical protein [Candidatus Bathyarchaeia archaeon]
MGFRERCTIPSIRAFVTRGSRALAGPGPRIDALHINQLEDLPVLRFLNDQSLRFCVSPPRNYYP